MRSPRFLHPVRLFRSDTADEWALYLCGAEAGDRTAPVALLTLQYRPMDRTARHIHGTLLLSPGHNAPRGELTDEHRYWVDLITVMYCDIVNDEAEVTIRIALAEGLRAFRRTAEADGIESSYDPDWMGDATRWARHASDAAFHFSMAKRTQRSEIYNIRRCHGEERVGELHLHFDALGGFGMVALEHRLPDRDLDQLGNAIGITLLGGSDLTEGFAVGIAPVSARSHILSFDFPPHAKW